jgi:hypothetical protein
VLSHPAVTLVGDLTTASGTRGGPVAQGDAGRDAVRVLAIFGGSVSALLAGLTPLTDLIDGDREAALAPSKSRPSPLSALIPSTARETVD